jgi:hypothetical protein
MSVECSAVVGRLYTLVGSCRSGCGMFLSLGGASLSVRFCVWQPFRNGISSRERCLGDEILLAAY